MNRFSSMPDPRVFHVRIKALPRPGSPEDAVFIDASVSVYVVAENDHTAESQSQAHVIDHGWLVERVQETTEIDLQRLPNMEEPLRSLVLKAVALRSTAVWHSNKHMPPDHTEIQPMPKGQAPRQKH